MICVKGIVFLIELVRPRPQSRVRAKAAKEGLRPSPLLARVIINHHDKVDEHVILQVFVSALQSLLFDLCSSEVVPRRRLYVNCLCELRFFIGNVGPSSTYLPYRDSGKSDSRVTSQVR